MYKRQGDINPKTGKPYDINSKDVVIRYDQNVTLTPEQQALFNQGQQINKSLGDLAQNQGLAQITSAMNNPLSSDIPIVSGVQTTAGNVALPSLQSSVENNAGQIQLHSGANERASGNVLNNIDQIRTQTQDPNLLLQNTTDALYKANTQYLDPQFAQQQSQLENKLANQGITRGSEAYDNAMLNFNNQKQQAYDSARNNAISGGMNAAQGMFGMNLQGNQFTNSALGQQFNQSLQGQQLANSAAGQNNQLDLSNQAAYNAALGQQFGQNLQAAQFGNQASLQGFDAAMNQANQLFGQNISNANLNNAASNQQLSQAQLRQQAPINIINALRSGQQMQVANIPNVGVSSPGQMANVAGADMLGAAQAQGQYNQSIANAQAASGSNAMSGGMGMVGMLGAAML